MRERKKRTRLGAEASAGEDRGEAEHATNQLSVGVVGLHSDETRESSAVMTLQMSCRTV